MSANQHFIGMNYKRGDTSVKMELNDEVIIHHIPGVSQAIKSYPAMIIQKRINGGYEGQINPEVVVAIGIGENSDWWGAWINDYLFGRLEFVRRNCDTFIKPKYSQAELDALRKLDEKIAKENEKIEKEANG